MPARRTAEAACRVGLGGRHVGVQCPLQSLRSGTVTAARLSAGPHQRETATWMRILTMVKAEFLGNRQKAAIVIAPRPGGITHPTGGGNAMHSLVQQTFE